MKRAAANVWDCVAEVVSAMDYEFVGAQYGGEDSGMVLRVFIDAESGISIDDCAKVSNQLSAVLDVEDVLSAAYSLEVSSPGLERPLFDAKDFVRFSGDQVAIRLALPLDGRRRFKGKLLGCAEGEIEVEVDGEVYAIPVASVEQAHLVPPADYFGAA